MSVGSLDGYQFTAYMPGYVNKLLGSAKSTHLSESFVVVRFVVAEAGSVPRGALFQYRSDRSPKFASQMAQNGLVPHFFHAA